MLVVTLAVYGWARSSVDRSTTARALVWSEADVGDQQRFPSRVIPAGPAASPLPSGAGTDLPPAPPGHQNGTLAYLVVHRDRLVSERYFDGAGRQARQTSFSVAKSFVSTVSTLVGIAIDEGLIGSVEDPVTYYGVDLRDVALNGTRIVSRDWVDEATAADATGDPADHYQYLWWVDVERPGRFYALGNYGQHIYMAPDADADVVRFGRDWGAGNRTWLAGFRGVADRLARDGRAGG
jgi:CubicO group peptidase (beta-lactamase class C family)